MGMREFEIFISTDSSTNNSFFSGNWLVFFCKRSPRRGVSCTSMSQKYGICDSLYSKILVGKCREVVRYLG